MTRSRAIVTVNLGNDPSYRYGLASQRKYAAKCGAEYIVVDEPIIELASIRTIQHQAWLQKLAVFQLLSEFEVILFLDADIIVTPQAQDIFEEYGSGLDALALYDESHLGRSRPLSEAAGLLNGSKIDLNVAYYNLGVFLVGRDSGLSERVCLETVEKFFLHTVLYPEQTYISYLILQNRIQVTPLPRSYNFMEESQNVMDVTERYKQNFIHYAGQSHRAGRGQKRSTVMRTDFCLLYEQSRLNCLRFMLSDFLANILFSLAKEWQRLRNKYE